jgi:hypothetical protein
VRTIPPTALTPISLCPSRPPVLGKTSPVCSRMGNLWAPCRLPFGLALAGLCRARPTEAPPRRHRDTEQQRQDGTAEVAAVRRERAKRIKEISSAAVLRFLCVPLRPLCGKFSDLPFQSPSGCLRVSAVNSMGAQSDPASGLAGHKVGRMHSIVKEHRSALSRSAWSSGRLRGLAAGFRHERRLAFSSERLADELPAFISG